MRQGKVIKAAGGFFTVCDRDNGRLYFCRARGALKKGNRSLIVGDWVIFKPSSDVFHPGEPCPGKPLQVMPAGEGVVEEVLPRKNCLPRPPVANVDRLVVVMSIQDPACDWQLISRMTVLAEHEELPVLVCLNKTDLADREELEHLAGNIEPYPYLVLFTSALSGEGLDLLKEKLTGCCSVLAGPSGVGKSTLLNSIQPGLSLQTATVSSKLGRGRHTTRQVSLMSLQTGGSVVDTPGFTRLDFSDIEKETLPSLFPELALFVGRCSFRNCLHLGEPGCAVKEEIGRTLNPMRYDHYRYFMEELEKQEVY